MKPCPSSLYCEYTEPGASDAAAVLAHCASAPAPCAPMPAFYCKCPEEKKCGATNSAVMMKPSHRTLTLTPNPKRIMKRPIPGSAKISTHKGGSAPSEAFGP